MQVLGVLLKGTANGSASAPYHFAQFQLDQSYTDIAQVILWSAGHWEHWAKLRNVTITASDSSTIGTGNVCGANIAASSEKQRLVVNCFTTRGTPVRFITVQHFLKVGTNPSPAEQETAFGEIEVYRFGKPLCCVQGGSSKHAPPWGVLVCVAEYVLGIVTFSATWMHKKGSSI